jgi:hypothetical protein
VRACRGNYAALHAALLDLLGRSEATGFSAEVRRCCLLRALLAAGCAVGCCVCGRDFRPLFAALRLRCLLMPCVSCCIATQSLLFSAEFVTRELKEHTARLRLPAEQQGDSVPRCICGVRKRCVASRVFASAKRASTLTR